MSAEQITLEDLPAEKGTDIVRVRPRVEAELSDLLRSYSILFQAADLHDGPVHLIIPKVMDRNIQHIQDALNALGVTSQIYFAHKACKSPVFPKQARKNGIGIDVASRNELISALSAGFKGKDIICTGPKNREFVRLGLMHNCLISCDSEDELEKITELLEQHPEVPCSRILIRISDVSSSDRKSLAAMSRFGMPQEKCALLFSWLHQNPKITLCGFHFHNDERGHDAKAGYIENIIRLMEMAYEAGHAPTIIDIGGGLRSVRLETPNDWSDFIDQVAEGLLQRSDTGTWKRFGMGMSINPKGAIAGREKIQGKHAVDEDCAGMLRGVLGDDRFLGRAISEIIAEDGFSLALEPGFSLLQQAGLTLMKIVGLKEASDGTPLILVDGNMYSISQGMTEIMYDPFLIPRIEDPEDGDFEAHVIGNMCREEDIITKRRIRFPQMPSEGDLICFTNTAAYNMD